MPPKRTYFQESWLLNKEFQNIIFSVKSDSTKFRCLICKKDCSLSNMGRQAIISHIKSASHKKALSIKEFSNTSLLDKFCVASSNVGCETNVSVIDENAATTTSTAVQPQDKIAENSGNLLSIFTGDASVLKAEILWTLHTIKAHNSINSIDKTVPLFSIMFPDSDIARRMRLGSTKASYLYIFGLAEYFKNEFLKYYKTLNHFSISFDESLNKISQKGQMDLAIRFYNDIKGQTETRYLTSVFISGRPRAENLLKHLIDGLEKLELNPKNIIHISMDGPNVNLKMYRLLKQHLEDKDSLLDMGTCGLHAVHGAFQTGHKATGWNVNGFLTGIYWLFKDSPARRSDFLGLTETSIFPLKFCQTRWVEGSKAASRALQIYDQLKEYYDHPSVRLPQTNSVKNVASGLKDPLMPAKIAFFEMIAALLEPFLTKFQSNEPLAPFLYSELNLLLVSLLEKLIKKCEIPNDLKKVAKIDFKNKSIYLPLEKLDCGFACEKLLKKYNVKAADKLLFRKDCQKFLIATITKIIDRGGLKQEMLKAVSCLNPNIIALKKESSCEYFKIILKNLYDKNIISSNVAEKAKLQYYHFIRAEQFMSDYKNDLRLDSYFYQKLNDKKEFENLFSVIKIVLILFHGNAFVEGGFSINKNLLVENLQEKSLIAQRTVFDAIMKFGGVSNIVITKEMLYYCRSSNRKYKEALEDQKCFQNLEKQKKSEKRKLESEIKELDSKKKKINIACTAELAEIDARVAQLKNNMLIY